MGPGGPMMRLMRVIVVMMMGVARLAGQPLVKITVGHFAGSVLHLDGGMADAVLFSQVVLHSG